MYYYMLRILFNNNVTDKEIYYFISNMFKNKKLKKFYINNERHLTFDEYCKIINILEEITLTLK